MGQLSDLIKTVRETEGLTQLEVTKKLGFHPQFISNIERGRCGLPVKYFKKMSKILKINIDVLIRAHVNDYQSSIEKKLIKN